jgi:hypothetical protein
LDEQGARSRCWPAHRSLLIGLAQIALMPPYAGFDETAHYSYIQTAG